MEELNDLVQVYSDSIVWGKNLVDLPENQWLLPMRSGGWSVAECLAHLMMWDRYILKSRFPYIKTETDAIDQPESESVNSKAALYARSGITQIELISEFVDTRQALVNQVRQIISALGNAQFSIRGKGITLFDYLLAQVEHHRHHQKQIDVFVEKSSS